MTQLPYRGLSRGFRAEGKRGVHMSRGNRGRLAVSSHSGGSLQPCSQPLILQPCRKHSSRSVQVPSSTPGWGGGQRAGTGTGRLALQGSKVERGLLGFLEDSAWHERSEVARQTSL